MLITTRTPLRASFVGGGTDLPSYYRVHGGAVVSTALPLHVDVSVRRRSSLALPRYRVACETYEQVDERDAISHPIVISRAPAYGCVAVSMFLGHAPRGDWYDSTASAIFFACGPRYHSSG